MHFNKNYFLKISLHLTIFLSFMMIVNSQAPTAVFLNDSATYNGPFNNTLAFSANITLGMNPIHTMELQSGIGSFEGFGNVDAEIEYRAGNITGFLLRFVVNDEDDITNDKITLVDCSNATPYLNVCTGSACGGKDFNAFANFTIVFNSTTNNATIHVGTANLSVNVCTNATMIESVRFISNFLGVQGYSVKNNVMIADNRAPVFLGNISNFTFQQNTFVTFNISGNFTDPDGENLTFGFSDLENITISINQTTGTVNITPPTNFVGLRFVRFLANDTKNFTFSGNISINVTASSQTEDSAAASGSSSSSAGSGGGGYICRLDWRCSEWSDCISGIQTRKCKLIEVSDRVILNSCPQHTIPEQKRNCTIPIEIAVKETCEDRVKNQNEEDVDCGGICKLCRSIANATPTISKPIIANITAITPRNTSTLNKSSTLITKKIVHRRYNINLWLVLLIILLLLSAILIMYKLLKKDRKNKKT
ncbi:hypothetical protein HYX08_01215 [Candidatus Woesearchaeota archaeon]|nr:hypothetical protein [Candidatus Woesearchaeota archaeon]